MTCRSSASQRVFLGHLMQACLFTFAKSAPRANIRLLVYLRSYFSRAGDAEAYSLHGIVQNDGTLDHAEMVSPWVPRMRSVHQYKKQDTIPSCIARTGRDTNVSLSLSLSRSVLCAAARPLQSTMFAMSIRAAASFVHHSSGGCPLRRNPAAAELIPAIGCSFITTAYTQRAAGRVCARSSHLRSKSQS